MITEGTVTKLEFRGSGDTVVQVDVKDVMKGTAKSSIEVIFAGGLQPAGDWEHVVLAFLESAPIPFVGDDVVLFLQKATMEEGRYEPQFWTGVYSVTEDEELASLEGNPFSASLKSTSVAELSSIVDDLLSVATPAP
jgi:hypothetical protein